MPLNAALRNGQEVDVRATIRHKDGHPVKVRARAVPLRDEFGKLVGAAEFIDPAEPMLWEDERKNMLAIHGCMDRSTGALTREYTETQQQANGIRADQVTQVRGLADQRLCKKDDPLDASNRRISLIVQYLNKTTTAEDAGKDGEAKDGSREAGEGQSSPAKENAPKEPTKQQPKDAEKNRSAAAPEEQKTK